MLLLEYGRTTINLSKVEQFTYEIISVDARDMEGKVAYDFYFGENSVRCIFDLYDIKKKNDPEKRYPTDEDWNHARSLVFVWSNKLANSFLDILRKNQNGVVWHNGKEMRFDLK